MTDKFVEYLDSLILHHNCEINKDANDDSKLFKNPFTVFDEWMIDEIRKIKAKYLELKGKGEI